MNASTDIDGLLRSWLEDESPGPLPRSIVRTAIADALDRPRRRRGFRGAVDRIVRPDRRAETSSLPLGRLLSLAILMALLAGAAAVVGIPGAPTGQRPGYEGTFSPTGTMTTARDGHTATLLQDGRVLIAGGSHDRSAELYDPATGTFLPTGPTGQVRSGYAAALLDDGRVLLVGGIIDGGEGSDTAELYDPRKGTFTPTGSLTAATESPQVTRLADGRVLVVSGGSDVADVYDPESGTFSPLQTPEIGWGPTVVTLADGHRVLLIAGQSTVADETLERPESTAWVLDVDSGIARLVDPLRAATFVALEPGSGSLHVRRDMSAILLADGHVLITGGFGKTSGPYPITEADLFDPETGTFEPTGPLTVGRALPAVVPLADGRVLVAGGLTWDGHGRLGKLPTELDTAEAELYDPETGRSTPTGPMGDARDGHTATLLADGSVLVAGGSGGDTAELYR